MIVVITCVTEDEKTRRRQIVADYGIDMPSGKSVVLPSEPPASLGAHFNDQIGEWVIA